VLAVGDIQPGGSGVRAQALDRSGKFLDDFRFAYQQRFLHVFNVPSPAATASLAIAKEIVATLGKRAGFPGRELITLRREPESKFTD
jgi:(S)-2-hydroxyglutarate dehydrogenase